MQKQLGVDVLLQEQQSTQDEEDISMAVVVEEGEQVEEEKQQAGMNTKSSSFNVKAPVFVPAEPCSSVVDDDAMVVTEDG